ncbi:unnamed protein product, partial [marine sediment metagenome]
MLNFIGIKVGVSPEIVTSLINLPTYPDVSFDQTIKQPAFASSTINPHPLTKVAVELSPPIYGDDFLKEELDNARKTVVDFWLAPMHKDFHVSMIDLDASRNIANKYTDITIDTLNIREATKTIADYKERVLWRGYDHLDRARTAANSQGIIDTRL